MCSILMVITAEDFHDLDDLPLLVYCIAVGILFVQSFWPDSMSGCSKVCVFRDNLFSLSLSFNPHQYLPKYPSTESSGHTQIPCPKSSSSFPSRLTYHWYSPLAYIGWRRALALSDVWSIREHFRADYLYALYQQCYDARSKDNFGQHNSASRTAHSFHLNTLRIIWSTLGVYFVGGAVFKLLHDMFMFINPIIMMYVGHTLPVGGNVFVF